MTQELRDSFGRKIDYLRISVTDRCNLRCIYCMPASGILTKPHQDLLTFEEIIEVVKAGLHLGITKIRVSGGEPLVRKNIVDLVRSLAAMPEIEDLALTTNGTFLKEYAFALKEAGLKRLNISLDSLNKDRYRFISRSGNLEDVKEGIERAQDAGFSPLKINVLLLAGINTDEILDFLRMTLENSLHVRFLEFMPVGSFYKNKEFVPSEAVLDIARRFCEIEEARILGYGPARVYRFKSALGTFGIINPMSDKFCSACNRLRLTSDGFLKVCLHSDLKVDLKEPLRRKASQEELTKLIKSAVRIKPKEHSLDKNIIQSAGYLMCQIGG